MKVQPSDLILRFDASSNRVLLLVPKSPEDVGTLKRFFEVPVPAEVTVSEFAGEIGVAVASFLHARHGDRFRVGASDSEGADHVDSEEVTFEDARLLIDRLSDSSTLADVEAVGALLKHASEHGDQEAAGYLRDTWPGLQAVFVRRVSRKGA
jgi:hypothetical protein